MKDHYPLGSTIPEHCLVPPSLQPEYPDDDRYDLGPHANIGHYLADAHVVAGHGDDLAVVHAETGRSFTYRQLADESTRLATGLVGWGVRPGDRIAFRSSNVPELLVAMTAAWKAGAVVVPTPVQARPEELQFFLADTGARLLVLVGGSEAGEGVTAALDGTDVEQVLAFGDAVGSTTFAPATGLPGYGGNPATLPAVPRDSVAVLWHTGGTTGRPKGCYHTHRRFLLGGLAVGEAMRPGAGERFAAAAPLGHALGFIYHTIFTLLHRATVVMIEDFRDPNRILDAVEAHGVNTFAAITATWARMLDALAASPRELPSLTRGYAMWQTASSTDVRTGWKSRGIELMNNFGSTSYATWGLLPRHDEEFAPASLGKPLPGYDIVAATVADGTVTPVTEGPGQMAWRGLTGLTYWNRAELQERDVVDGWSLSDDLIQFDESGNADYLGRTDYMISTAGYKVAPAEVEIALSEHAAVREVSVVGAPCPMRGEMVVAFVALEHGIPESDELVKELQSHVKARLSPYKYPRRIHFVEAIPRDPVGKVRGRVLKDWASAGAPQPTGAPSAPTS